MSAACKLSLSTVGIALCVGRTAALPSGSGAKVVEPSLLAHAVRVQDRDIDSAKWSWCEWVTDKELLLGQGAKQEPYTFYRKDVVTGKMWFLKRFSQTYESWNHCHTTISPDGRFALWRGSDDKIHVVGLLGKGKDYYGLWDDPEDEHDDLVWMPDSRHWLLLSQCYRKPGEALKVYRFDIRKPKSRQTLKTAPISEIECITPEGTVLSGENPDDLSQVKEVTVVETRLSTRPVASRRCRIPLPSGKRLTAYDFSPKGDRIAWTFRDLQTRRFSIWISSRSGTNWREIGALPVSPDLPYYSPGVYWIPGGEYLAFTWAEASWKIPVK